MAKKRKFRVYGDFNGASEATVVIDPEVGLFTVRPLRQRRTYELPFSWAAEMVVQKVIKAETIEKRKAKKVKRGLL